MIKQKIFDADELEHMPDGDYVVLNSGSHLMLVEAVEGDRAIVSWQEGERTHRRMLPIACLSRLTPYKGNK